MDKWFDFSEERLCLVLLFNLGWLKFCLPAWGYWLAISLGAGVCGGFYFKKRPWGFLGAALIILAFLVVIGLF